MCDCWVRRSAELRSAWIARESRLPDGLRGKTFENFNPAKGPDGKPLRNGQGAVEEAKRLIATGTGWLLIQGEYSKGKTHLAAAIVNALMECQEHVVYSFVPDLLDKLISLVTDEGFLAYFEALRACPYAVFDDLGTEKWTEWKEEKLTQIFNHRCDHNLPTVITTNKRVDSLPPRIAARINRMAVRVVLA